MPSIALYRRRTAKSARDNIVPARVPVTQGHFLIYVEV